MVRHHSYTLGQLLENALIIAIHEHCFLDHSVLRLLWNIIEVFVLVEKAVLFVLFWTFFVHIKEFP